MLLESYIFAKMKNEMWKPNVKDWEKIPLESYKLILSQTKEQFEECASESESITNKSIKLLGFLVLLGSGIIGYGLTLNKCFLLIFILFYAMDFYLILKLVFPKNVIFRGTRPQIINWQDFDEKENTNADKIALTYYQEIIRTGDSIDKMMNYNSIRHNRYKVSIIFTAILFISGIALLFILHP